MLQRHLENIIYLSSEGSNFDISSLIKDNMAEILQLKIENSHLHSLQTNYQPVTPCSECPLLK